MHLFSCKLHFSQHKLKHGKRRNKTGLKYEGCGQKSGTSWNEQLATGSRARKQGQGKRVKCKEENGTIILGMRQYHQLKLGQENESREKGGKKKELRNPLTILGPKQSC